MDLFAFVFCILIFVVCGPLPAFLGMLSARKLTTGRYTSPPKVGSFWRNTQTGEVYVIGVNAHTIWFGRFPEETEFDRQKLLKMEYTEFYDKCVEMTEEDKQCEEGLQALAELP